MENEVAECANLIDLSLDENHLMDSNTTTTTTTTASSCLTEVEAAGQLVELLDAPFFPVQESITATNHLNNISIPLDDPFESHTIQNCIDNNPFDLLENEVCERRRQRDMKQTNMDIKTARLLALSDDELLSNDEEGESREKRSLANPLKGHVDRGNKKDNVINVNQQTPSSNTSINDISEISGPDSDSMDCSLLPGKSRRKSKSSSRTRLLKLSLTNSATSLNLNSPLAAGEGDMTATPPNKHITQRYQEPMLSAESPLKLIDESESELDEDEDCFEADLKLLTIPILNEINDNDGKSSPVIYRETTTPSPTPSPLSSPPPAPPPSLPITATLPSIESTKIDLKNFEAIKAKLNSKRQSMREEHINTSNHAESKDKDIHHLIKNLQSLISEGEISNEMKRNQANELLEKLHNTLSIKNTQNKDQNNQNSNSKTEEVKNCDQLELNNKDLRNESLNEKVKKEEQQTEQQNSKDNEITSVEGNNLNSIPKIQIQPQPIRREGTFDIDLRKNNDEKKDSHEVEEEAANMAMSEIPNCMLSSSATYDGETNEEKAERLNIPEIAPLESGSFTSSPASPLQPDVNEIVEQLGKLLAQKTPIANAANQQTVIVVMNTPTTSLPKQNLLQTFAVDQSPARSPMEYQGELELPESSEATRPRSQSLSLHDKMHIFQFPLNNLSNGKEADGKQMNDDNVEFKTPARFLRRNSYSNGSRSSTIGGNYSAGGGNNSRRSTATTPDARNSMHQTRSPLDTAYEGVASSSSTRVPGRQSISKFGNLAPMHNFRMDNNSRMKKVLRQSSESIMASSKPLKATIPVKKVAPLLAEVQPLQATPTGNTNPMRSSTIGGGSGQQQSAFRPFNADLQSPRACSTPSVSSSSGSVSSMRRNSFGMSGLSRSRYSMVSSTTSSAPSASPITRSSMTSSSSVGSASSSSSNRLDIGGLKRRSITDFKAKSPIKPRVSSSTMSKVAAVGNGMKLATSKLANSKIMDKLGVVKETSRLSRFGGQTTFSSVRNKENHRP